MMFFTECKTLDELKKAYRLAAMKHHPDHGGDVETMKQINADYGVAFEALKNAHNTKAAQDTTGKAYVTKEDAGDFIQIIDILMKLDGLEVELCGRWLWIGGNTMKHKDALKAAGCKWAPKKKLWSWHFMEDSTPFSRRAVPMDKIREKYGSVAF